jgi:hypothetical protein
LCVLVYGIKRIILLKFVIFDFPKFFERDGKDNFGSSCFECKEKKVFVSFDQQKMKLVEASKND